MVLLEVLTGPGNNKKFIFQKFPVRIGRSPTSDLKIEAEGVWQQHAQLEFNPSAGFFLRAMSDALVVLNGADVREARLKRGDVIEVGAAKLRFDFAPVRQRGLELREFGVWLLIFVLAGVQLTVVAWLTR